MPASASIHFCFHYASFLQSFQINFTAFLNFKAYKKNLVLLTLVSWDLFRNLEDAFALVLRVAVSPACIQWVPGTVSPKTSRPLLSSHPRSEDRALPRMSQSCPTEPGQAIPAGHSQASHPCLHAQQAHSKKAQLKLVGSSEAEVTSDLIFLYNIKK